MAKDFAPQQPFHPSDIEELQGNDSKEDADSVDQNPFSRADPLGFFIAQENEHQKLRDHETDSGHRKAPGRHLAGSFDYDNWQPERFDFADPQVYRRWWKSWEFWADQMRTAVAGVERVAASGGKPNDEQLRRGMELMRQYRADVNFPELYEELLQAHDEYFGHPETAGRRE